MAKFRKKPVVIEAIQFEGNYESAVVIREWAVSDNLAIPNPIIRANQGDGTLLVSTLEGHLRAVPGDWIIRGVKGEYYPCKPDIFDATYEAVSEQAGSQGDDRAQTKAG